MDIDFGLNDSGAILGLVGVFVQQFRVVLQIMIALGLAAGLLYVIRMFVFGN